MQTCKHSSRTLRKDIQDVCSPETDTLGLRLHICLIFLQRQFIVHNVKTVPCTNHLT